MTTSQRAYEVILAEFQVVIPDGYSGQPITCSVPGLKKGDWMLSDAPNSTAAGTIAPIMADDQLQWWSFVSPSPGTYSCAVYFGRDNGPVST